MALTPRRARSDEAGEILALLRDAFACMDGRIDPPSSLHRLTEAEVAAAAAAGRVLVAGAPVQACLVIEERPGALYLGKLAVAAAARRQGLARRLLDAAEEEARRRGLPALELQTRVGLSENHAAFAALGFVETGRTAHPGHASPTSVTFRRTLAPAAAEEPEP